MRPFSLVPGVGRALLVTGRADVLDDLLRLAAAAGAEVEVAADVGSAHRPWTSAPLVIVGPDVARECARRRLPRREGVVLIGEDLDDAGIWQLAVEVGAEHVVFLPDAERWLVDRFHDATEPRTSEGAVVAVVGGRGGAGATTLACALAVTAARSGRSTLLVDGDRLGGGIDLVFGGEDDTGLRWRDLSTTRGRLPAAALADALPRMADLSVLSWDRGDAPDVEPEAMHAVLEAGRRASELVVVDLPRAADHCTRAALACAQVTLLVVPAEVRAAAAASRVAASIAPLCADLRVVVRGPSPSGLGADQIADALRLPLAGDVRPESGVELALDRGQAPALRGRGPLAVLCGRLLDDLLPAARRVA